jgi:Transposase, Mutator family
MTAPHIVDPARLLDQALSDASPDLMRHLLSTVINALCSAEADAVCGAEWGQVSPERVNQRNRCRHRELDTRPARSRSQSGSCAPAATSRSGCWSGARGPRRR